MDYNTNCARESLTHADAFGDKLKRDSNFCLKSPATYQYNCIAFAMGMQDRWVDTGNLPWHWWPPAVEKGMTVAHLVKAFQYFGFEDCGMDESMDEKYDKIAIYQNNECWTHAARIVADGIYHSKFGASYDGIHSCGDVLQAQYGTVVIVMRRLKADACLTEKLKDIAPGEIHLNIQVKINGEQDHLVTWRGKTYLATLGYEVKINHDHITCVNKRHPLLV